MCVSKLTLYVTWTDVWLIFLCPYIVVGMQDANQEKIEIKFRIGQTVADRGL